MQRRETISDGRSQARTVLASMLIWASFAFVLAVASVEPGLADHVPVVAEEEKLLASDGASDDWFGESVAISGETLVAATERHDALGEDSGAVYVFQKEPDGGWSETAKLVASDGEALDRFGSGVGIDGDWLVVGAQQDDDLGESAGAAYVFERMDDGTWMETAKLVASDGAAGDLFGGNVALSANALVVGSEHADPLGDGSGAAYVFERSESGVWLETARLLPSDGEARDAFGCTVAISGDRIAVAARGDDDDQGGNAGAVYVFNRIDGVWVESAKLVASDGEGGDLFGSPVAIDGDVLVAGATGDDDQGFQTGAAYIFEHQEDGGWLETTKFFSPHPDPRDGFGKVGISAGTIVVGAADGEWVPDLTSGTADLFRRDDTGTWVNVARLLPSDPGQLDQYGLGVAIDGATVVVGARLDDDLGPDSGSAYVFSIEDCLLRIELHPRAVPAGTPLRVGLHLEHNRPETVTVPFRLWVEDPSGTVIASRTTEPITFRHGDTLHRELTLPIPADAPPGEYRLLVGVERMRQGMAARVERFRVVGAETVAPVP